jgi:cytochrome P450
MPLLDERSEARRAPFASALLEATRPPDGDSVPLEQDEARQAAILDEISVMLLAGHETTASVLSWLLWELAGVPEEQDRIARLVHAPASERSGSPADSQQGALDAASPWIAAMIQESLRLYPPIAFLLRETTGDVTLRGKPVPANSYIVVSPWTIQRHRRVWQAPDAFDPKRWMEGAPPRAMENRTAFIPFGQGPRVCPGKRFADLEMNAILSELLGACRFTRASGGLPRPLGSLTSRPDRDFRLIVAAAQSA